MTKVGDTKTGSISGRELYTLKEIKGRLGLSTLAIWRARWNGLKVHKVNRCRFVLGDDFITYLESFEK